MDEYAVVRKSVYDRDMGIMRDALREAIGVIEGLADQQAMQDDWYLDPVAYFKAVAGEET